MDEPIAISSFGRVRDGSGSLDAVERDLARLRTAGAVIERLKIAPLRAGWSPSPQAGPYRDGASAAFALREACTRLGRGVDAVVVEGDDSLRSGYSREERRRLTAVYGEVSIPEAYTALARAYARRRGWSEAEFRGLADALLRNHLRRASELGIAAPPPHRYEPLTTLFRDVDCANPVVDFSGRVVVVTERFARSLALRLTGLGTDQLDEDGPDAVDRIVPFEHLRRAFDAATDAFGRERLVDMLLTGDALLELYTCFPIVPLAALLETGLVEDERQLRVLLEELPVTVTAGMNLGRGPWSNAALNGLIAVCEALAESRAKVGLVQANGGLGYRQGWMLVERDAPGRAADVQSTIDDRLP